jgi:integrase
MKVKLTNQFIKKELICPEDKKQIECCDTEIPGLYILVAQVNPGRGTYYLRYKNDAGKTCHKKIGRTTDISLADARSKAKTLRAEIALGGNPREDEKTAKSIPTYATFMRKQYFPYIDMRKRSAKNDHQRSRRIIEVFGDKRLNQITRQQIQQFHSDLRTSGLAPSTCDKHLALLRYSLNLAVNWGYLDKCEAKGVPLFNVDNQVEHYLDENQLGNLLVAISNDPNRTVCNLVLFLLSTGARLMEAQMAKWEHVNIENRVWYLPSTNTKSKKVHSMPLNDTAIKVLRECESDNEYVFVNERTGTAYNNIHKSWNRIRKAAGLPHLRLHDLRHNYASHLVNSGRNLYEVQRLLNHSTPIQTQRYARLSSRRLADASSAASDVIQAAMDKVALGDG